jgi:hypothetical protein
MLVYWILILCNNATNVDIDPDCSVIVPKTYKSNVATCLMGLTDGLTNLYCTRYGSKAAD